MKRAGIPLKIFAALALLALMLLLVPMLKAAEYDVPSADDYSNGLPTYQALQRTGSMRSVFKAAWDRVYRLYFTWQGTFSAIFLFTLNPMIFGEQYYQIGPWIILAALLSGIFILTFTVASRLFRAEKSESLIIAVVWAVISTQFLPRASQGIYWYTGAVYYTFFFGVAAMAFSVIICYIVRPDENRGWGKLACACLLMVFIGGGNLVTGLAAAVLLVSMEALLILMKNKNWKPLLIPVLCYMVSFGLNVAAPGNSARQKHFAQPGLFRSVIISFEETAKALVNWFSLPVLALLLILIPVLWRIVSRSDFKFRMPGLVTLYSVCLSAVMFYPPIYAMTAGDLHILGRITNVIFFTMAGLFIFNLFYWLGWLAQRNRVSSKHFPIASVGRYSILYLLVLLLVFAFGMTRIKWFDTTSISAFRSYRSGEMGNYSHTYKGRLKILKDPEITDAVLKRFPYRPYVLYYQELSGKASGNTAVARWYGKKSVICK